MTIYFHNNLRLCKEKFTKSIFKFNCNYYEHTPIEKVKAFIKNKQGVSLKSNRVLRKSYDNENQQMELYLKKYDKKKQAFAVKYKLPEHKWGRIFPDKSLSLCVFHRPTRHAYAKEIYIDIDMKNAHPVIVQSICNLNGISCPTISAYCTDRENFLKRVCDYHNVDRSEAKTLMLRLTYGGEYENWLSSIELKQQRHIDAFPDILNYQSEMDHIRNLVFEKNPHIIADVEKADPSYFKNPKYKTPEDVLRKKKKTCMSHFCNTIERYIQEGAIEYLVNNKGFVLQDDVVPCQDGFMIKIGLWYNDILKEIQDVVLNKIGFNVEFLVKEFDEACEIRIDDEEELIDGEETPVKSDFQLKCEDFEKTHCKIINKSFFVKQCEDGFKMMTEKQIITSYKHITFKDNDGKTTNFIERWLRNNNSIKCYDDVGIYPNKAKCPANIFNLWEEFAMEKVNSYTKHEEGLTFILNHIKILCKNEIDVFDFLICWMAHIIQRPDEKSIAPVLISKEGAGKSTLILLISRMIGKSKLFETAKPSRDVWGNFNGRMKDCFFVNLNELCLKEMQDFDGEFKKLITEPTLTINDKGISQYEINSFHRFFITSNKEIPIKTGRRTFIIRCSDDLISNTEYFNKFYSYMDDVNVVKTFYEYLKNFTYNNKDMSYFREMMNNPPRTEYELEIRESTLSIPEMFLKSFTYDHINETNIEQTGKEMFELFTSWKINNGIKWDSNPQKLGVSITYLNLRGITKGRHTNHGDTKIYNIPLLKQHFKIGDAIIEKCAIDLGDITDDEIV